jgi:hypothetical protein
MDNYALMPADGGGFLVQVRHDWGGTVSHRFRTEAEAVAWIVERKEVSEAAERQRVNLDPRPGPEAPPDRH